MVRSLVKTRFSVCFMIIKMVSVRLQLQRYNIFEAIPNFRGVVRGIERRVERGIYASS